MTTLKMSTFYSTKEFIESGGCSKTTAMYKDIQDIYAIGNYLACFEISNRIVNAWRDTDCLQIPWSIQSSLGCLEISNVVIDIFTISVTEI